MARFFSTDSSDLHPENKLSEFTVEFDHPIDLGDDNWEVGVSQLYLTPARDQNIGSTLVLDQVNLFDNKQKKMLNIDSMEQFASFIVDHSTNPELYVRDYFFRYLNPRMVYTGRTFAFFFNSDAIPSVVPEDRVLNFTYDLTDLLEEGEKFEDFAIKHLKTGFTSKAIIQIPTSRGELYMINILNMAVKYVLLHLRHDRPEVRGHAKHFHDVLGTVFNNDTKRMNSERRAQLRSTDVLLRRFINRFVSAVEKARDDILKDRVTHTMKETHFLMLYCDIIQLQIVGSSLAKVVYMIPYQTNTIHVSFLDERVRDVQYARLEKTKFKSITFSLRNEHGELINFVSGISNNFIALHFRKII